MSRLNLDVPDPTWIGDDQAASELLRLALRKVEEDPHDFIGYDLETHAMKIPLGRGPKKDPLDWMNDTVTFWGLSFKTDGKYERYCLDQQHFQYFIPLLENPKANLVTWNGKYDAHVSENSGVNVWESNYMDFQVCAQMLNENVQLGGMDLKKAAFRGFDSEWRKARTGNKKTDDIVPWSAIPMTKFKDIFGDKDIHGDKAVEFVTSLYNLPRDLVVNYTSLDPYATVLLAEHMREVMLAHDLSEHSGYENMWEYFTEFEVFMTEILWRMERRGLEIDVEALKAKIEPMEQELEEIQAEINSFAGRPVNLHPSSKDLQELLFGHGPGCLGLTPKKMTKGGATEPKPSTNKEVLTEYAAEGVEIAQYIQRFRKVDKIKGTYVVALISLVEHYGDGRIHPTFKQYGARTGRFSTKDPNSQNFPRPDTDEFGIRQAFIAREGYILIVADYGQLEMRIMAHFSQDPTMLDAIRRGLDLHSVSVEKMYGIPYEDVVGAKKRSDIVKWDELTDYEKDCLLK
jgi:DNA polymerase I-like protein with 3'-5' exonuclease and polymerase domains